METMDNQNPDEAMEPQLPTTQPQPTDTSNQRIPLPSIYFSPYYAAYELPAKYCYKPVNLDQIAHLKERAKVHGVKVEDLCELGMRPVQSFAEFTYYDYFWFLELYDGSWGVLEGIMRSQFPLEEKHGDDWNNDKDPAAV